MDQQEEDFNQEEDTSVDGSQSAQNDNDDQEDDESIDYWKEKARKAEEERDNYKQGLLSAKKKRNLDVDRKEDKLDVDEDKVASVLNKRNEAAALEEVVDPNSDAYIPELVNDAQYNEIIGYLPRNLDKSSPKKIVKALKLATKMWKSENGIEDKPKSTDKKGELSALSSVPSGKPSTEKKQTRTILRKQNSIDDWY